MQYTAPHLARRGASWLLLFAAVCLLVFVRASFIPPSQAVGARPGLQPAAPPVGPARAFAAEAALASPSGRTITVNTTADTVTSDGRCSLREALMAANGNRRVNECAAGLSSGADVIKFNLSAGTPSIALMSPLPAVTQPVQILGDTGLSTRVELNGAGAGAGDGLTFAAGSGGSLVRNLVINRFTGAGIYIQAGSGNNAVEGCYVGTDATGAAAAGNTLSGIEIEDSPSNRVGGTTPGDRNVIAANGAAGVLVAGAAATGNLIVGNYVGTDATGVAALGNTLSGVIVDGAPGNTVGGLDPNARNVISGNGESGVFVCGAAATGNVIEGNLIGTDATGLRALGNAIRGVSLDGAPRNTVGGTEAGARNVIAANGGAGVGVFGAAAAGNVIAGNYVGVSAAGAARLGNGDFGVVIEDASATRVGGLSSAARNVISGNSEAGVIVAGGAATGNVIEGNFIGTDAAGAAAIPNAAGVAIDSASENVVGGPDVGARNVIAGNAGDGVVIGGGGRNRVENNLIGANATGTGALGNGLHGVLIVESSENAIGGVTPGVGNVIAFNGGSGVLVAPFSQPSVKNALRGNAIFSNALTGIDLSMNARDPFTDGATANDAGDADAGTNGRQNAPVINSVTSAGVVSAALDSLPTSTAYPVRVEFFAAAGCDAAGRGAGEVLLGAVSVGAPGSFTTSLTPAPGRPFITATATDADGNTSEFAACRKVNSPPSVLAVNVTHPAGSTARRQIATVSDPDHSPGTLAVTAIPVSGAGVAVRGVSVNAAGEVFADITATCAAATSAFTLTVTDGLGEAAQAGFTVSVAPGLPPALGVYAGQTVGQGATFIVTPSARPADDGALGGLTVSATPGFAGQFRVSPTTGAVSVSNAGPPGHYAVTVTAADACGLTASRVFQLTVDEVTTTLTDAAACLTPGSTVKLETRIKHFGPAAESAALTVSLPAALAAVPDSCRTAPTVGACDAGGGQQVTWSGPVNPGDVVTISYEARVTGAIQPGAELVFNSFVHFGAGAAAGYETRHAMNCEAADAPLPASARAGGDKPGSVLFFPVYASNGDQPNLENTRLSLTNHDESRRAYVRVFFVNGVSGGVADSSLCLGPTQTASFLVSDYDPGVRGYVVAVAVDAAGVPTKFNQLTGSAFVKLASGHAANLGAVAFAAIADAPAVRAPGAGVATLKFDGMHYNAAPRTLALSNLPAPADGNETLLILSHFGGDLSGQVASVGSLGEFTGMLFDGEANAFGFSFTAGEGQLRRLLSDTFPRTQPRWTAAINQGQSGWLLFGSKTNAAVVGVSINKAASAGGFSQGHNLHCLDVTTTAAFTVPITSPGCQ